MLKEGNRFLVMDILHRLELKESVSVDELIYLHRLLKEYPEVEGWVEKLFDSSKIISSEINPSKDLYAA
tara:strand:- start:218 stop:424 length:207 start_codon:yes stop_codon:yes gene_type:complete